MFPLSLKVCDLHQGKTYVFRVRAVNANGVGKPSDTSEPVLVEARPGETCLFGCSTGKTSREPCTWAWMGGPMDSGPVSF